MRWYALRNAGNISNAPGFDQFSDTVESTPDSVLKELHELCRTDVSIKLVPKFTKLTYKYKVGG